jgi:hypothetical protein
MLAFVHIPKTAGTTLHKILFHQYPRVFIHHDTDGPPDSALAERVRNANPQVIMGHFSVGIHAHIPEIRYITCLRDPVSRITSHYQHARNDPTHYLHDAVVSRNLSLADYASSGLSGELSNGMTRMIAGIADFHQAIVTEQTLALAKSNIETLFDAVILSEHFDEGILMLADSLDWKTPYYLRRKVGRYGAASREPDARTRGVIARHNKLDCELHAWATRRFESQAAATPDLAARVRRFQKNNSCKGKFIFCLRELRRRVM